MRQVAAAVLLLALVPTTGAQDVLERAYRDLRPALAAVHAPHTKELVPSEGLRAGDPSVKGVLTLSFLLLRGSGWDRGLVAAHLERVAAVYAQCGLRVDKASLLEIDPPGGRTRFSRWKDGGPGSLDELAAANPSTARPVFYLFAGFDDADDDAAFSRADFEEGGGDPRFFDSVFLPAGVNSPAYLEQRRNSPYSVAAHELWHVLTRVGEHYNVDPPNLSNIWRTRSDLILPRDCPRILANPLVRRP